MRSETIIILTVLFMTIVGNFSVFLYRNLVTPTGRVFAGTQFYSDDYAVYVSYIKQGQQGRWTTVHKYTTEPHRSSLVHEEYLLLGKLTKLFKLSPVLGYHLTRLFLCLLFLLSIYCLALKVFPKESESSLRLATFILATLSNGFLTRSNGGRTLFLSWLTELDPTQRFGAVPHYQLGFVSLLGIFVCFYSILTKSRRKYFPFLTILGLVGGFVLPASLIVALGALAVFSFLIFVRLGFSKDKNLLNELKLSLLTIFLLSLTNLPTLLYHQSILKTPSWGYILAWEAANKVPFTLKEYLLALGPVSFLTPLSFLAFKERKRLITLLFSWLIAVFLCSFVIAELVGFNPTRFLQNPVYIPMAILAVLGIKKTTSLLFKNYPQKVRNHSLVLTAGLMILLGLPTTILSLRNQFEMYNDFSSLVYPEDYFIKAFEFLEENTEPNETILALYQAGNQIPFLAGNTVYLGHLEETLNYPSKVKQAKAFYSGGLTDSQAENFLTDNGLKLVFSGPQEKSSGGTIEKYSFLEPVFDNQQITIFRLKDG